MCQLSFNLKSFNSLHIVIKNCIKEIEKELCLLLNKSQEYMKY